ncbi:MULTISPECIES: ABC transporter substrate-binding protein [unclassified Mesorhizobium]|uniref:ABC transporter substrate-binding protein n=1 Tax=unclassified Mesorhizobium TaxID=325217 RepID=UPI001CCADBDC|nr:MULTISPECIES: ABC transporter substrate-binding protein [unclassified Mesorhizobium]MBZ9739793.1 ABC transporter substrate-binding protein [Mesorhizobium sp. CO1-1-4]MBZ9804943.1 ABC transporter substrate-binding protein [Mesorhizobium sp. ES1-6]
MLRSIRSALVVTACAALQINAAAAAEQVIVATTGGAYEKALREAWFGPFTAKTGIEVVTVAATNAEMRAKAAAMVKTGNVSWDLYLQGEIQTASAQHMQAAENLSDFCKRFATRTDLAPDDCTAAGVRLVSNSTLLAYRSDAFGGAAPRTWADMWDLRKFPGGRSFPDFNDPWRVMAAALLADGVSPDKLFPLDIDRALAKLDTIRPAVSLWWKTGDQSMQGFRNREYVIGQIWLTRARALKAEGLPIAWSHAASFLVGDRIALIKNAPHRENALKLADYWLSTPAAQAKVCEALSCKPPSSEAVKLMSSQARADMPGGADSNAVVPDAKWINDNAALLLERWNAWVQ